MPDVALFGETTFLYIPRQPDATADDEAPSDRAIGFASSTASGTPHLQSFRNLAKEIRCRKPRTVADVGRDGTRAGLCAPPVYNPADQEPEEGKASAIPVSVDTQALSLAYRWICRRSGHRHRDSISSRLTPIYESDCNRGRGIGRRLSGVVGQDSARHRFIKTTRINIWRRRSSLFNPNSVLRTGGPALSGCGRLEPFRPEATLDHRPRPPRRARDAETTESHEGLRTPTCC